jgi:hypothetical protein
VYVSAQIKNIKTPTKISKIYETKSLTMYPRRGKKNMEEKQHKKWKHTSLKNYLLLLHRKKKVAKKDPKQNPKTQKGLTIKTKKNLYQILELLIVYMA